MKIATAIPQTSLEKLSKNSRMFSYLMTSFTKTYGIVEQDSFTLYFKGNKSVVSMKLPLEVPVTETLYFSIDINKFLSAAKKIGDTVPLKLLINTTPPSMLMTSDATNDKITFSVTFYEADSPEIAALLSFYDDRKKQFENGEEFVADQAFLDFAHIATTYMGTINKNNSIAMFQNKLVYAHRTVVVGAKASVWQGGWTWDDPEENRLLHKFILGFIDFVAAENSLFTLSTDKNLIRWVGADPTFWAILAIDPCTITIPGQSDLDMIVPDAQSVRIATITPSRLAEAIDFFSGLFEASVWKPITFAWSNDPTAGERIVLTYKHPTTEVEKELAVTSFGGNLNSAEASFTLISDSLRTLLNRMTDSGSLELRFNDLPPDVMHGAGIELKYFDASGVETYSAVLAKLADS